MSHKGWRQRWREGQARTQAINAAALDRRTQVEGQARIQAIDLAGLDRRLEGAGAEERLDRIQTGFRQALTANRPKPLGLGVLWALVFLTVVALGLVLTG